MTSERVTLTLPRARYAQMQAIATKHGLDTPTALINHWVARSIAEGDIPDELPDFGASALGDTILLSVKGQAFGPIARDRARLLAAILATAGGEKDPELEMTLPAGKPVAIDMGGVKVAVSRVGAGVRLVFKRPGDEEGLKLSMAPRLVADAARILRTALAAH